MAQQADPLVSLHSGDQGPSSLEDAHGVLQRIGARLRAVIRGRDAVIDLVLVALVADGHVLLEDYPGSGKTTLAKALGESIEDGAHPDRFAAFRRIQFTPDLLPSDITGTSVFEAETGRFVFRPGPLFAHVVLADEINRTSPKVQAAMLEAMAEKQVTADNQTYPLDDLFFVIATQNPLDIAGTYPLPTPQLDRFLFKIVMRHIHREAELEVLAQYPQPSLEHAASLPRVTREEVMRARRTVRERVAIAPVVKEALVDLAGALRSDARVLQGTSTRSLVLALPAMQARAVLEGRDYVGPEDLSALAPVLFEHRIECAPGIDDPAEVVRECAAPQVERLARESLQRR
jgi:MoxR-like ATPase